MTEQPPFAEQTQKGIILRVRLTPGAARESIGGVYTDEKGRAWLRAAVTIIPEKGKANAALTALLSKTFGLRKSAFTLVSGETDRHKTFLVDVQALPDLPQHP